MASRTDARQRTDPALLVALACAAVAAFAGQLAFGTQPGFFLPLGICALPFAASPRRQVAYRAVAAGALVGFIVYVGIGQGSFFIPSLLALLYSVYTATTGRAARKRQRR